MRLAIFLLLPMLSWISLPADAELTPWADLGLYRLVSEDSTAESLARLEVLQGSTGPALPPAGGFFLLVTVFRTDGRFTVFVGAIERGGLNIPFVNLREVENPVVFLRDLDGSLRDSDTQCQIPVLVFSNDFELTFECRTGTQAGGSGRLIPLRPPLGLRSTR